MAKRQMLAVLRSDTAQDVERYSERESTAILYGDRYVGGPMIEATLTRTPNDEVYVHLAANADGNQRRRLMTGIPYAEFAAAEVVVPLTLEDVTDIAGALQIAGANAPERVAAILKKLGHRR